MTEPNSHRVSIEMKESGPMVVRTQRHIERDWCPYTWLMRFMCREVCFFSPVADESLGSLANDAHHFIEDTANSESAGNCVLVPATHFSHGSSLNRALCLANTFMSEYLS